MQDEWHAGLCKPRPERLEIDMAWREPDRGAVRDPDRLHAALNGKIEFLDGELRRVQRHDANPHQPRKVMEESALKELAASIRENGVIQPVLVRRMPDGYELVAGERRLRASRLAEQKTIPALVCTMEEQESLKLALLENIQREDLNAIEEAEGVEVIEVESAHEMRDAVLGALPVAAGVFAAAVADWRVKSASGSKIKKVAGALPVLEFEENPDILKEVSGLGEGRPELVVGFAAETDDVVAFATAKRARKGCDWIVANDVSPATGIMGGTENAVVLITADGAEPWPRAAKDAVARQLAARMAEGLKGA